MTIKTAVQELVRATGVSLDHVVEVSIDPDVVTVTYLATDVDGKRTKNDDNDTALFVRTIPWR